MDRHTFETYPIGRIGEWRNGTDERPRHRNLAKWYYTRKKYITKVVLLCALGFKTWPARRNTNPLKEKSVHAQRGRERGWLGRRSFFSSSSLSVFADFTLRFHERKWLKSAKKRARDERSRTMERKAACWGQIKEELAKKRAEWREGVVEEKPLSPSSH